jgi:hypothetical protein
MNELSCQMRRYVRGWLLFALALSGCGDDSGDSAAAPKTDSGMEHTKTDSDAGDTQAPKSDAGKLNPCSGLPYFIDKGICAASYEEQRTAKARGPCSVGHVLSGSCDGHDVWMTEYHVLGDPVSCVYDDNALVGASICTDTTMSAWTCGAARVPSCLTAGVHACKSGLASDCGSADAGAE